MPVSASRLPLTRASKSPSPTMRNQARRGGWSRTNSLRNIGQSPLVATPAGGAIHWAWSNSAAATAAVVSMATPICTLASSVVVLISCVRGESSCWSNLPTLSVRAPEILGQFWLIGAARFGAVPLDLGACPGTGREVPEQQELSDRGGVFEVGASWLPRFAALQEMSDGCALDSRDALGRNRKCPVHRLGQDPGSLAIASRVHDAPAADIERPAVKPFPEIAVKPLLEICQHGWVIEIGRA